LISEARCPASSLEFCSSGSARLLELLIEEMYVDDGIEELLGDCLHDLPKRRYPQAIARALLLRHSWRADDLACLIERLGLTGSL
jgi:hypothetical protein